MLIGHLVHPIAVIWAIRCQRSADTVIKLQLLTLGDYQSVAFGEGSDVEEGVARVKV